MMASAVLTGCTKGEPDGGPLPVAAVELSAGVTSHVTAKAVIENSSILR